MTEIKEKKELYYGLKLAIPMLFYVIAIMSPMFLRQVIEVSNSDYISTTLKLIILSLGSLFLFPQKIGIPEISTGKTNLRNIGIYKTGNTGTFVLYGLILGVLSLIFMLSGSLITGKYVFDTSTIDPKHIYFSLVPGIFEEIIFRGFIMIVLIKQYKSIKKAALFQIVLFTVSHMNDFTFWGLIDTLTVAVIAIAFTYVAFKTGNLITGIIFHFIHDAFLFVVQLPEGRYEGIVDNLIFYISVWIGMGLIILAVKTLSEKIVKPMSSKIYQNALNMTKLET